VCSSDLVDLRLPHRQQHHPETDMLRTIVITTALTGFMVGGAFAQATTTPPTTSTPPAATAPAPATTQANSNKFIEMQGPDHWVFSKFKGTDVLGPDNAHIGDVTDLVFDKNGKIMGVVVGVGGFLGIGEKNVAIDMSAFQVVPADTNSSTASRSEDPNNIKLKVSWTKDQLKQAPAFAFYKASSQPTVGQGNRMAPTTPAPTPAPAR